MAERPITELTDDELVTLATRGSAARAKEAAAELDRRGVEPETPEPDPAPIAGDADAYARPLDINAHGPFAVNAAGTQRLERFRVDAVVYAPTRRDAQALIEQAGIYLDAAALEPEHDAPIEVLEVVAMLERLQGRSWPGRCDPHVREARGALTLLAAALMAAEKAAVPA